MLNCVAKWHYYLASGKSGRPHPRIWIRTRFQWRSYIGINIKVRPLWTVLPQKPNQYRRRNILPANRREQKELKLYFSFIQLRVHTSCVMQNQWRKLSCFRIPGFCKHELVNFCWRCINEGKVVAKLKLLVSARKIHYSPGVALMLWHKGCLQAEKEERMWWRGSSLNWQQL